MLREAAIQVDVGFDMAGIVNHAFHVYDDLARAAWDGLHENEPLQEEPPSDAGMDPISISEKGSEFGEWDDDWDEQEEIHTSPEPEDASQSRARSMLQEASETLLFASARVSSLCATLILLNLCLTHGCSNIFVTELFTILRMSILLEINTLPRSKNATTKLFRSFGLSYKSIHVSPNNCMLFKGGTEANLHNCRLCQAPRFKQARNAEVPRKVLRHFSLIPRLQRLFSTPPQADLQTWWQRYKSCDPNSIHGAQDSEQWHVVDRCDPTFAADHRNIS